MIKEAVREATTICSHPLQVDLWPFDRRYRPFESGTRVMCDVGYLCANFSLPRPLRPDVCERQTSDMHHHL